ncbi:MAG: dienelactone hydrolase family protein [Novosphingobium sp.]|nr:dienelactone hydrolase family protein [Novosphingobium sp.]
MCDEFTAADNDAALARASANTGLSRREFAAMGTAAAVASYATLAGAVMPVPGLTERMVAVPTPDGSADAFLVHPAHGRHPGVILWPDVLGLREVKKAMARRLAGAGYAVLVVNPYYRTFKGELGLDFAAFRTPEGQAKLAPARAALTPEAIAHDGAAYAAFLDTQAAVDKHRGIGTQGYCMGGPFTIRTAAAAPARVKAAASFHGGGLVTAEPSSPHLLLASTQASYLIDIARNDDEKAPTDKDTFRAAAAAAKRPAEIEVYAADHGWCVPDAPAYNQAEAERAWARLLVLYAKL